MVLSRSTWQNNVSLRGPKTVRVESLGADVILRPMTAARQSAIDEAHPVDDRGIIRDAKSYVLAIIAALRMARRAQVNAASAADRVGHAWIAQHLAQCRAGRSGGTG